MYCCGQLHQIIKIGQIGSHWSDGEIFGSFMGNAPRNCLSWYNHHHFTNVTLNTIAGFIHFTWNRLQLYVSSNHFLDVCGMNYLLLLSECYMPCLFFKQGLRRAFPSQQTMAQLCPCGSMWVSIGPCEAVSLTIRCAACSLAKIGRAHV